MEEEEEVVEEGAGLARLTNDGGGEVGVMV